MAKGLNVKSTPEVGTNQRQLPTEKGIEDTHVAQAATGTVIVACKIPNGLILQCSEEYTAHEAVSGGGYREVKMFRKAGEKHFVRGPKVPQGMMPTFELASGAALTSGIPADFWERWLEEHKNATYVLNGLVFASKELAGVRAHCRENENVPSLLEPIDPANLPQAYKKIEMAEEMLKRAPGNRMS